MSPARPPSVLRRPTNDAARRRASHLVVLLHGVGANAEDMFGLTHPLAEAAPDLAFSVPDGIEPFSLNPTARQWFSIAGVTEENRPARVDAALPALRRFIEEEAAASETPMRRVVLVGFSQGTIMALHLAAAGLGVGAVLGLSGRLAAAPEPRARWPRIHLIHGAADPVMPLAVCEATRAQLGDAGCAASLTVIPGLGHGVDARVLEDAVRFIADVVAHDRETIDA